MCPYSLQTPRASHRPFSLLLSCSFEEKRRKKFSPAVPHCTYPALEHAPPGGPGPTFPQRAQRAPRQSWAILKQPDPPLLHRHLSPPWPSFIRSSLSSPSPSSRGIVPVEPPSRIAHEAYDLRALCLTRAPPRPALLCPSKLIAAPACWMRPSGRPRGASMALAPVCAGQGGQGGQGATSKPPPRPARPAVVGRHPGLGLASPRADSGVLI